MSAPEHRLSWLVRVPVGVKLTGLAGAIGLALFWPNIAYLTFLTLVFAITLGLLRPPGHLVVLPMASVVVSAAFIVSIHCVTGTPSVGIVAALTLITAVLGALVFSLTVPVAVFMDAVRRWLKPLSPLGVKPDIVALLVAMAMRYVPFFTERLFALRDARLARGASGWSPMLAAPLVVMGLQSSDELAQALEARGFDASENTQGG